MPTKWEGVNVVCPFYRLNQGYRLTCDGLIKGTFVTNSFRNEYILKKHMDECCNGDYSKCKTAQALTKMYDELDKEKEKRKNQKNKERG